MERKLTWFIYLGGGTDGLVWHENQVGGGSEKLPRPPRWYDCINGDRLLPQPYDEAWISFFFRGKKCEMGGRTNTDKIAIRKLSRFSSRHFRFSPLLSLGPPASSASLHSSHFCHLRCFFFLFFAFFFGWLAERSSTRMASEKEVVGRNERKNEKK